MSDAIQSFPASPTASPLELKGLYSKVIWRLMPFLMLAYMINAIDRLNLSFAKLRMADDIALTDAAYGLGAGIFYLGYILFEVPSNLYLQRIGARATLTRIMVLWGLVTIGTAFVTTANQLIVARFLLGVAEAGFFPGVILYLTYWFPAAMRGRITAAFIMAGMVAGIICGPLSGTIMAHLHGWAGLHDWQMLFILTGIPAVALGLFGWFWLTDRPEQARWLSDSQKRQILAALASEKPSIAHSHFGGVLRDPRLYIAGLVFFCIYSGFNTVSYWMPTLIRSFGLEDLQVIGLVNSLPFIGGLCGMYLVGRSSDRHMERRWHLGVTMLLAATCFVMLGFVQGHALLSLGLLTLGAAAALSAVPLFWTIPPALLSPAGAAGGIAIISSIGGIAGIISQAMVGAIKTATGDLYLAFDLMAAMLVIGALLLLIGIPADRLRERHHGSQ
ncbi:MFS transporter [Metapseudomonas lalkuanensis]|uniref:MFS transporter n=1 Tax=Metapseudomonas lalkuanensis TaxID=2604832 RepID=A0A5J6QMD7_9GAMM|nr:MFS transporter [Pseudomonas lalkuanensis]QEY62945.1 MFS transporter [Pseudomonas lalkuanensis]